MEVIDKENRKKSICFFVPGYPTKDDPLYAFIRPVVTTIADKGYCCTVICAQSVTNAVVHRIKIRPYRWIDYSENGEAVTIIQPKYVSLSSIKWNKKQISSLMEKTALEKAYRRLRTKSNLVYAHFWDVGIMAASAVSDETPIVVVTGEETIDVYDKLGRTYTEQHLCQIRKVICVSQKNKKESDELGLLRYNPATTVIPNAVNPNRFYKKDKAEVRKKLGIPADSTVAVFVGDYNERKGIQRLLQAAAKLPELRIIAIGSGALEPQSDQVIYKGLVPNSELVDYLNAGDMFVLPTLAEGCCNAIIEAMACGLPVISSNKDFNDDILDESNSIRIDSSSVEELYSAMKKMLDDVELREMLATGSLETAKRLTIEERVNKILAFIERESIDLYQ